MKKYILIAGVNGAGISTLYQINDSLKNMLRINVDEIVKDIQDGKDFYIPTAEEVLDYDRNLYLSKEPAYQKLREFFQKENELSN